MGVVGGVGFGVVCCLLLFRFAFLCVTVFSPEVVGGVVCVVFFFPCVFFLGSGR